MDFFKRGDFVRALNTTYKTIQQRKAGTDFWNLINHIAK
jgi:hypothetical protein